MLATRSDVCCSQPHLLDQQKTGLISLKDIRSHPGINYLENLRNNLKSYDLIQLEEILKKEGFSLNNRAEDLPCSTYINIVKSLD